MKNLLFCTRRGPAGLYKGLRPLTPFKLVNIKLVANLSFRRIPVFRDEEKSGYTSKNQDFLSRQAGFGITGPEKPCLNQLIVAGVNYFSPRVRLINTDCSAGCGQSDVTGQPRNNAGRLFPPSELRISWSEKNASVILLKCRT